MCEASGNAADTQPKVSPFCVGAVWEDPSKHGLYADGNTLVKLADGREGRITGTGTRGDKHVMHVQVDFTAGLIEVEYAIGDDECVIWPAEVVKVSRKAVAAAPVPRMVT
ncbi:MAG: hypothetical protein WC516_00850 [Patescibacteria group bacterium]